MPVIVFQERTEDEEIERLLQEFAEDEEGQNNADPNPPGDEPLGWPTQDPVAVTTEGYIAMTFPILFPFGGADLRDAQFRKHRVGIAEYFDALLRYKDGRFARHHRYVYSKSFLT